MFPEGTPDMQSLLEQAASMQEQLASAQEQLAEARVDGTAGGGLVQATVSGAGELVGLTIDPQVCDPDDPETLADLVLAAVRDASSNAQQMASDQVSGLAGGLGGALGALGGGEPEGDRPRDEGPSSTGGQIGFSQ